MNDLPGRALLDAATRASLLVIGARSISAARALVHESISRIVVRDAPCPVAVVRDCATRDFLPIAVGIDGSGPSRRALRWAIEHARIVGRPLVAIHACRHGEDGRSRSGSSREVFAEGDRFLRRQIDQADTDGLTTPVACQVATGPAADTLIEASATSSLVVVGSRGQGALSRALLGSVSDRVSHRASSPVVVVP